MSLCLGLLSDESIIIASDSRSFITVNDIDYVLSDELNKIYQIDNMIVYTVGIDMLCNQTIQEYKYSKDKSLENLTNIARKNIEKYKQTYSYIEAERYIDIMVAKFEYGKGVLYSFSSVDDFTIMKYEGTPKLNFGALGAKTDIGIKIADKLFCQASNRYKQVDMDFIFEIIYQMLQDEKIGGTLQIYYMTKDGTRLLHTFKIEDYRDVKYYDTTFDLTGREEADTEE